MGFFSDLTEEDFKVDDNEQVSSVKPIRVGAKKEEAEEAPAKAPAPKPAPVVEEEEESSPEGFSYEEPERAPAPVQRIEEPKKKTSSAAAARGEFVVPEGITLDGSVSAAVPMRIRGEITGNVTGAGQIFVDGGRVGGEISTDGNVTICENSTLENSVSTGGSVAIEKGSVVSGQITAKNITIKGMVKGDLEAQESVKLYSTARVRGNILCRDIEIEKGAVIAGGSITQTGASDENW